MLTITNIRNINPNDFDETWAIVRKYKGKSKNIVQVKELSPSPDLFCKYSYLLVSNMWDWESFQKVYVPQFLYELKYGDDHGYQYLNELYKMDKAGKKIALVCFCEDERLCHRSIICGLLQAVRCDAIHDSNIDYTMYYKMFNNIK